MNLNTMTVTELRKLAAQHKIAGRSTMKKAELIDALSAPEVTNLVELSVSLKETDEILVDQDTMDAINEAEAETTAALDNAEETPAPASDHNPNTDGLAAAFDYTETKPQRVYSVPVHGVRVEMEHHAPGRAVAEISTNEAGIFRSTVVVKVGRRWELTDHQDGVLIVVKARTLGKLAKTWARKLGLWADDIRVSRAF